MKESDCKNYVNSIIKMFGLVLDNTRYEDLLLNFINISNIAEPLMFYFLSSDI